MVFLFGYFIVAIIIIGLIVKFVWGLFRDKDKEIPVSEKLIEVGADVIIATLPSFSDNFIQFLYDLLNVQRTGGEESISLWWLLAIGGIMLAVGIFLKIKDAAAQYVILNMPGTIHHTNDDGMLKALKTKNSEEIETSTVSCQTEMQRPSQARTKEILRDIDSQMTRFNSKSNYKRCFTGMAPIPFVLYAGTKHKGKDIAYYLEFNKAEQQYVKLSTDKKYPKLTKSQSEVSDSTEIVVAVSTTAAINDANTQQFNMPVFRLSLAMPKDNAIFSKRQLDEYVNETVTYISEVCKNNSYITRVNLLLATQACFAYALGKSLVLMQNRVPEIVSYHYVAPSYKIGLIINGSSSGQLVKV